MKRLLVHASVPLALASLAASLGVACSGSSEGGVASSAESLAGSCSLAVTANTYDGPQYWGTITVKNTGASKASGFSVGFDVPSGAHCTNDSVPSGAVLSPLSGSGSSAQTTANHCVYTFATTGLAAGASRTFNYSTDSTSFSAAKNVVATGSGCSGGADAGTDSGHAEAGVDAAHDAGPADTGATDSGHPDAGGTDAGGGLFAHCSLDGGCIADCSPPANDPIATGNAGYDLYDGCILAAMEVAGMTQPWMGQLLKAQAYNESGITPVITTNDNTCGGQNCGIWAISAGTVSGDSPPGPCGSSAKDPSTGQVDYSHSYGIFQDTPACEGTFLRPTLPPGYTCTPTTEANNIPFGPNVTFYCESATSLGVSTPTGTKKGYINVVQDKNDPLYATSLFNPAYDLYVYIDYSWALNFQQANANATGCTAIQQWYLSLAYWLTGNATSSCKLSGAGLQYVQTAIGDYETVLYNKTWPYPGP